MSVITYIKNKNKPEKIDFEEGVKIFCALSLYVGLPAAVLGYGYYTHTQITKFYETGELNEEDATPLIKRLTEFYNTIAELINQESHQLNGRYKDFMLQRPNQYMVLQQKLDKMNQNVEKLNALLQKQENVRLKNLTPLQRKQLYISEIMPPEFLYTFREGNINEDIDETSVEKLIKNLFIVMAELQKDVEWQPSKEQLITAQKTYENYVRSGNLDETAQQEVQKRLHNYFKVAEKKYRHSLDYMKANSDEMKINDPKAAAALKNSIIQMNKTTYWYQAEQLKNPQVTVKGISPSRVSILLKDGSFEDFVNDTRGHFKEHPTSYPHSADNAVVQWDIAETAGKPIIDDYLVTQRRLRKEQADRDAIVSNQKRIINQNEGTIAAQQKEIFQLRTLVSRQQDTLDKQEKRIKEWDEQQAQSRRQAEDAAIGGYVIGRALGR